jgi:hypothetical protein
VDLYLDLLNASVKQAVNGPTYGGDEIHNTTQNGIVTWTSEEKGAFFNVLARKGRNAVPQIAALIGSKSEMEVRDYLDLLQGGLEHKHLVEQNCRTVVLGDIPAAFEISEECCQALEGVAETLCLGEEKTQNETGRRRYGDTWRIDRLVADTIESQVESAEDEGQTKSSIFTTAKLLDIGNWIELSERIFMNAGERQSEDNWTNLTFKKETPSITCEAFSDFYALAVSITRRLVQSSIFFAISRLRAVERGGYRCGSFVRREDVSAALKVLKMKPNSKNFWAGVARRCRLDVEDIRNRKDWRAVPLTYDEVEERLSCETPDPNMSRKNSIYSMPPFADDTEEHIEASDNVPDPASPASSPRLTADEDLSDREELHASIIDQRASHAEELRLWELLGQPPPSFPASPAPVITGEINDDPNDNIKASNRPTGKLKTKQDLVDWRDRTLYRNEWEEFGHNTTAVDEELSENRRKRRRIEP